MTAEDRTRLHITPFNPSVLDRFVPASLKAVATNISFHTVETFPERGFGYVELPVSEAQKLKKKLNGTMLKGTKVKIEEAKPEKKRKSREEAAPDVYVGKARKKAKKEETKGKVGELVVEGHELPEGRHVKRGWAEDKTKSKKSSKSDDSIKDKKMKFKTVVPPNKDETEKEGAKKSRTKEKKAQEVKKSGRKEVVVTEGKKTSRPAAGGKARSGELKYEDGQGWVNDEGEVIEAETEKQKRKRERAAAKKAAKQAVPEPEPQEPQDSNTQTPEAPSLPVGSVQDKEVHPLEALFKRAAPSTDPSPRPKPTPIDTSFSFFGAQGNEMDEEDNNVSATAELRIPQTPRTKEDLEWRGQRSAAPTPDTAAIGKRFDFRFMQDEQEEEEDEDEEMFDADGGASASPQAKAGAARPTGEEKEESEFRKWFYENRGALNRGWKRRRKDERKSLRQRENRRIGRRVA
ncbi:hypothetical protein CERZMDRAFT_45716 [Cercospora zeae-maydis SCOH1-5]|uniref:RRM domain-containing protein n=1 Tax=Cercospora zeae-maydis SCOH1-5 TaxID=717836 RepID=A0A6A6F9U2_9PEZI|nr:hypothetical protein CERZMDRAFT_45716 [Cercospora zeae-maydis SCOH1-5]